MDANLTYSDIDKSLLGETFILAAIATTRQKWGNEVDKRRRSGDVATSSSTMPIYPCYCNFCKYLGRRMNEWQVLTKFGICVESYPEQLFDCTDSELCNMLAHHLIVQELMRQETDPEEAARVSDDPTVFERVKEIFSESGDDCLDRMKRIYMDMNAVNTPTELFIADPLATNNGEDGRCSNTDFANAPNAAAAAVAADAIVRAMDSAKSTDSDKDSDAAAVAAADAIVLAMDFGKSTDSNSDKDSFKLRSLDQSSSLLLKKRRQRRKRGRDAAANFPKWERLYCLCCGGDGSGRLTRITEEEKEPQQ